MAKINNLISFGTNGLSVANYEEVKEALIENYKNIFGNDIDISDTTADGVYVSNMALVINNILQTLQAMYTNLDIQNAYGQYLDTLCKLSNIYRKDGTYSYVSLELQYNNYISYGSITESGIFTPEDLTIVDSAGVEWQPDKNYDFSGNNTIQTLVYYCKTKGAITFTPPVKFINTDAIFELLRTSSGGGYYDSFVLGSTEETDVELRQRQIENGSGNGQTTLSSLQAALLNIQGIEDVKIINNDTPTGINDDGVVVNAHEIYPIIRYSSQGSIDNEIIGNLIYTKLTPGIGTTQLTQGQEIKDLNPAYNYINGTGEVYEYLNSKNGIPITSLDNKKVCWKRAKVIDKIARFNLSIYSNFNENEVDTIANSLIAYMNNLQIGYSPSSIDLFNALLQSDPKNAGMATYTPYIKDNVIQSGFVNLVTDTDFISFKNVLTYFEYNSYFSNIDTENNICTIQLVVKEV